MKAGTNSIFEQASLSDYESYGKLKILNCVIFSCSNKFKDTKITVSAQIILSLIT